MQALLPKEEGAKMRILSAKRNFPFKQKKTRKSDTFIDISTYYIIFVSKSDKINKTLHNRTWRA